MEKSQKNRTMCLKVNSLFPKYLAQLQKKCEQKDVLSFGFFLFGKIVVW